MRLALNAALAMSIAAGLCACQTAEQKPQVQAAAPQPGMDSDIRKILVAGGLDANAPGTLQTTKMPAEVQQAVAALQGSPAPAASQPATQVAAGPAAGTSLAAPAAVPPMIAAVAPAGRRGRRGASQFALAPTPTAMPPAVAVAAAAASPSAALAYAPAQPNQQLAGLPAQSAAQQAPIPSAFAQAAQQAAAQPSSLSQVQSYLPPAPPHMRTIVLTGPNADRRSAQAALSGVALPSPRATQAAVRAMSAGPAVKPVAAVAAPAPEPVPEEPRVRRF